MLNPQIFGSDMPCGFAGYYARQPDMVVRKRSCGATNIQFGTPVKYDENKNVVAMTGTDTTADQFVGVAGAEVNSSLNYLAPSKSCAAQTSRGWARKKFETCKTAVLSVSAGRQPACFYNFFIISLHFTGFIILRRPVGCKPCLHRL